MRVTPKSQVKSSLAAAEQVPKDLRRHFRKHCQRITRGRLHKMGVYSDYRDYASTLYNDPEQRPEMVKSLLVEKVGIEKVRVNPRYPPKMRNRAT